MVALLESSRSAWRRFLALAFTLFVQIGGGRTYAPEAMAGSTANEVPSPSQLDFSFELSPDDVAVHYDSTTGYSAVVYRDLFPFVTQGFVGAPMFPAIQERAVVPRDGASPRFSF